MSRRHFLDLWRDPACVIRWGVPEWTDVLPRLTQSSMLAHAGELFAMHGVDVTALPPAVQRQLKASASAAWVRARSARWESGEVARLFADVDFPLLLLKGASYLLTGALPGRGRFLTDVDLLVPKASIPLVRERLVAGGWVTAENDDPDALYFQEWLHQVPSFRHGVRHAMLDLHHTVIAPWGGHRVDVDALFAHAVPTGVGNLLAPSTLDRCLIVAGHFVRSDAVAGAFRDLSDLHELMQEGAPDAAGREALWARAHEVGLARALGVASHFAGTLLGTPTFGPRPLGVRARALAMIPDGARRSGVMLRGLRRAQQIAAYRAALPLRVMVMRSLQNRLGKGPAPLEDAEA